jgi:hypothetical protein
VRFVRFHGTRHPRQLGAEEIHAFLSHLAVYGSHNIGLRCFPPNAALQPPEKRLGSGIGAS